MHGSATEVWRESLKIKLLYFPPKNGSLWIYIDVVVILVEDHCVQWNTPID